MTLIDALSKLAELEKRATPAPWWHDSYNTTFAGKGEDYKQLFHIPDHPQGGSFEPGEVEERSEWYCESMANAELSLQVRNLLPELLECAMALSELNGLARGTLRTVLSSEHAELWKRARERGAVAVYALQAKLIGKADGEDQPK